MPPPPCRSTSQKPALVRVKLNHGNFGAVIRTEIVKIVTLDFVWKLNKRFSHFHGIVVLHTALFALVLYFTRMDIQE